MFGKLKCTMPKCRAYIGGMTGLQEINVMQKHFARKHKISLGMNEALEVRIDMENGQAPNLIRAMLGTERLNLGGK